MQRNNLYFVFVAVLCNFHNSESLPSPALDVPAPGFHTTNSIESKQDFLESVYTDCTDNKGSVPCFKYKLFAFVDKILNKDEINLANGVTVVRTAAAAAASSGVDGAPRSLDKATEGEAHANDVATMLMRRVERFLNTHTLKVDLRGSDVLNAVSRAGRTLEELSDGGDDDVEEEGRGKKKGGKKGGKMMGHLLLMLKMKLLGLIPLAFGLIALLAGKALLIGKLALLLSLIILLKKLVSSHQKTVTYEVVAGHPHSGGGHDSYSAGSASDYGASGGSSHGGWGRSADAHDLAYKAYKPTNQKAD